MGNKGHGSHSKLLWRMFKTNSQLFFLLFDHNFTNLDFLFLFHNSLNHHIRRWDLHVVATAEIVSHLEIRDFIWKWFKLWNRSIDIDIARALEYRFFPMWQSIETDSRLFLCGEWWWCLMSKGKGVQQCVYT